MRERRHPIAAELVGPVVEELDPPSGTPDVLPQAGIALGAVGKTRGVRLARHGQCERDPVARPPHPVGPHLPGART